MKKNKIKLIVFFTLIVFLFILSSNLFLVIKSYAQDNHQKIYYLVESKPRSGGGFSTRGSKGYKSFSKPKSTIIKPDSGGFSTKPSKSYKDNNSKSVIKPDSGRFSTKPKNEDKSYKNKKYNDYEDYSRGKRPIFSRGGFYGLFNPFYSMMYGFRTSSWIIKLVVVITIIVVLYIVIDVIRNRKR